MLFAKQGSAENKSVIFVTKDFWHAQMKVSVLQTTFYFVSKNKCFEFKKQVL